MLPLAFWGSKSSWNPTQDLDLKSAWATWRINPNTTGALIRVRRSSDSAEIDVTDFASSSFLSWASSDNLYCVKWYDQTSFGNTAQMLTAANQPRLLLNFQGGKPALRFDGSQYLSTLAPNFLNVSEESLFFGVKRDNTTEGGSGAFLGATDSGSVYNVNSNSRIWSITNFTDGDGDLWKNNAFSQATTSFSIISLTRKHGSHISNWINSSLIRTTTHTNGIKNINKYYIGRRSGNAWMRGEMSALIVRHLDTDQGLRMKYENYLKAKLGV